MSRISCTSAERFLQTLVDLQNGQNSLLSHRYSGTPHPVDLPVKGALEDRAENPVAGEHRAGDDAGAGGVDEVEHLRLRRVLQLVDAVHAQWLGRAPVALVKRCDETLSALESGLLGLVGHRCPSILILARACWDARVGSPLNNCGAPPPAGAFR